MKHLLVLLALSTTPALVPARAVCITCNPGPCLGHCSGQCTCIQPQGSSKNGYCAVIEDREFFR